MDCIARCKFHTPPERVGHVANRVTNLLGFGTPDGLHCTLSVSYTPRPVRQVADLPGLGASDGLQCTLSVSYTPGHACRAPGAARSGQTVQHWRQRARPQSMIIKILAHGPLSARIFTSREDFHRPNGGAYLGKRRSFGARGCRASCPAAIQRSNSWGRKISTPRSCFHWAWFKIR